MKIIIPMAGKGSRFQALADQNPVYKIPKPLIPVHDKPMVVWALESLPFVDLPTRPATTSFKVKPKDLIFICLAEHEKIYGITKLLQNAFGTSITVLLIPQITRGAVETTLTAKEFMTDEELIISDSDHFFDGENLYKAILNRPKNVVGTIPVFVPPDNDPKWSFTLTDKHGTALEVGEKDAELAKKGAFANIGAYYFARGNIFRQEAEEMIAQQEMYGAEGKKEFYVAPIYQRLIDKHLKSQTALIPQVWGLGTPQDLEYFLANYNEATSLG